MPIMTGSSPKALVGGKLKGPKVPKTKVKLPKMPKPLKKGPKMPGCKHGKLGMMKGMK